MAMKNRKEYEKRVHDFNLSAGSNYIASINFLTFRKTKKGMKVSFTLGKPHEIEHLRCDVQRAGKPYYCKF